MSDDHLVNLQIDMAATATAPAISLHMVLNAANLGQAAILSPYRKGKTYEAATSHIIRHALDPGDHMVDGGAHVGHMSLVAAATVGAGGAGTGRVTSFEPMPQNAQILHRHAQLNGMDRMIIIEAALSDSSGQADLHINADMDAGHALWDVGRHEYNEKSRTRPQSLPVRLTTLAESLAGLPDPRLIKLDVEGAEVKAISGAGGLLVPHRVPYVIAEVNLVALYCMNTNEMDLRDLMRDRGYQEWAIADNPARLRPLKSHLMYGATGVFNLLFSTPETLGRLGLRVDCEPWTP